MESRRKRIRIAIVDYDGCAVGSILLAKNSENAIPNPHPHFLSQALIDDIKQKECHAFFGCTHRTTGTAFEAAFEDGRFQRALIYHGLGYDPTVYLTTSVTNNLATALAIPCLAVSTPDDYAFPTTTQPLGTCGAGYETFLKPYEIELVSKNKERISKHVNTDFDMPDVPAIALKTANKREIYQRSVKNGARCKNTQLLMIAQLAREKYPSDDLELFFYDDVRNICEFALNISAHFLPKSVTLHVHEHNIVDRDITALGKVESIRLLDYGLFSSTATALTEVQQADDIEQVSRLNPC